MDHGLTDSRDSVVTVESTSMTARAQHTYRKIEERVRLRKVGTKNVPMEII